jgi:hypothetical protein
MGEDGFQGWADLGQGGQDRVNGGPNPDLGTLSNISPDTPACVLPLPLDNFRHIGLQTTQDMVFHARPMRCCHFSCVLGFSRTSTVGTGCPQVVVVLWSSVVVSRCVLCIVHVCVV